MNIERRLRLHRYLSATDFLLPRILCLFLIVAFVTMLLIWLLAAIHNIWNEGVILASLFSYLFFLLSIVVYTESWWERNVIEMAKENSLAAVGPLLDMAARGFLLTYKPASKPETLSEKEVFTYLPDLLSRMSGGDGPALSARQQHTLLCLITSPRYAPRFDQPGLRAKIDAILRK